MIHEQRIAGGVSRTRECSLHNAVGDSSGAAGVRDLIRRGHSARTSVGPKDAIHCGGSAAGVDDAARETGRAVGDKRRVAHRDRTRHADPQRTTAVASRRRVSAEDAVGVLRHRAAVTLARARATGRVADERAAIKCSRDRVHIKRSAIAAADVVLEATAGEGRGRGEDVSRTAAERAAIAREIAIAHSRATTAHDQNAAALVVVARRCSVGVTALDGESIKNRRGSRAASDEAVIAVVGEIERAVVIAQQIASDDGGIGDEIALCEFAFAAREPSVDSHARLEREKHRARSRGGRLVGPLRNPNLIARNAGGECGS